MVDNKETIYSKLYEDGTLIVSSYDYIATEKDLKKDYQTGNIPSEDKLDIENVAILDRIIITKDKIILWKVFFKV